MLSGGIIRKDRLLSGWISDAGDAMSGVIGDSQLLATRMGECSKIASSIATGNSISVWITYIVKHTVSAERADKPVRLL